MNRLASEAVSQIGGFKAAEITMLTWAYAAAGAHLSPTMGHWCAPEHPWDPIWKLVFRAKIHSFYGSWGDGIEMEFKRGIFMISW